MPAQAGNADFSYIEQNDYILDTDINKYTSSYQAFDVIAYIYILHRSRQELTVSWLMDVLLIFRVLVFLFDINMDIDH